MFGNTIRINITYTIHSQTKMKTNLSSFQGQKKEINKNNKIPQMRILESTITYTLILDIRIQKNALSIMNQIGNSNSAHHPVPLPCRIFNPGMDSARAEQLRRAHNYCHNF